MKIQCDVCEKKEASVFCAADEAALCEECDCRVHHANKLASKHLRSSLLHPSFKDAPLCDICQEKRAFLFCREDRAILCRECDISIHKTNEHTQNHNRFLLTGVKISASTSTYHPTSSPHSSCSSEPNLKNSSNNTTTKSSVNTSYNNYDHDHDYDDMFNQYTTTTTPSSMNYDQLNEDGSISKSNTISEYLMETLPGWRLEDLLDSSSANFSKNNPSHSSNSGTRHGTIYIRWQPPPVNWHALNTDGAARGAPGLAGGGGLIRDHLGQCNFAFSSKFGTCNAFKAELRAIGMGLEYAKRMHIRKLIVQVDNKACVSTLKKETPYEGECMHLVTHCRELLQDSNWEVELIHVYREGNRVADWLANHGVEQEDRVKVWHNLPTELNTLVFDDIQGVAWPRPLAL